jgi:hypothetical protein
LAIIPSRRALDDPDLRDRLYELLEHDHLPHSVGSRFVRFIIGIISPGAGVTRRGHLNRTPQSGRRHP